MSDYKQIFTIRLEHNYYMHNSCRAIQLRVAAEGISLLRRRGLMFKQTAENEWSLIGDCASAGVFDEYDVLELDMILIEPQFVHFTDWKDYQTRDTYRLDMPCEKDVVEPEKVMHRTDVRRKGNILSSVYIKLSYQMFEKAKIGKAMTNTLVFHARKVGWEYILIPRCGELNKSLYIEDGHKKIEFSQMEKIEIGPFPYPVLSSTTTSLIPMKEHYDFVISLIEIVRKEPLMKRVLIKHLQTPRIGSFFTKDPNTIRQIMYY